jgi:hypothetical protein
MNIACGLLRAITLHHKTAKSILDRDRFVRMAYVALLNVGFEF